jgi:hypothetical protein
MEILKNLHKRGLRERRPKRRVYQEEAKNPPDVALGLGLPAAFHLGASRAPEKSAPKDAPAGPERSRRIKLALACIVAGTLLMAALLSYILIDLRSV